MAVKSAPIVVEKASKWFSDFFYNLPLGIYRTTLEGKLVFGNKALAQMLGFASIGELVNYPVVEHYRNKKDRGFLVEAIMRRGRVVDLPLSLQRRDKTPIWVAVTARAVLDDDGIIILIDGIMRDITEQIESRDITAGMNEGADEMKDLLVTLDLQGGLLDINKAGAEMLGFPKNELKGRPLFDFVVPRYRDLFSLFLSDILKTGSEEGILTFLDKNGVEHHIEFNALLIRKDGRAHHIKGKARDVTEKTQRQKERLTKEKLEGVLEMAGGVAHRLNQPLMIINNMLNEVLSDANKKEVNYKKIVKVHEQIKRLNEISKKIAGIRKYEAMDYVAGVKIVDIDRAS
jgi:PAS domain S-box-containing protein